MSKKFKIGDIISFYSTPIDWISMKWQKEQYIQGYGKIIDIIFDFYRIEVIERLNKREWSASMYLEPILDMEPHYMKKEPEYIRNKNLKEFLKS